MNPINPFAEPILQQDLDYRVRTEEDPTPRYSASTLGYCVVQAYYKVLGTHAVSNTSFEADCRMEQGNAIHAVIQRRYKMRHPDALIEAEIPDICIEPAEVRDETGEEPCFTKPLYCSGRPDIFQPCPADEDLSFVIEIKSGSDSLLKGDTPAAHAMQGGAYWRSLYVDWVYFFRVNRATSAHNWKHFAKPWEHWREALRLINLIERHRNELRVPPPIPAHVSKTRNCADCGCFYLCYHNG